MSVTFSIFDAASTIARLAGRMGSAATSAEPYEDADEAADLNLSNTNARDFLEALDLATPDLSGSALARDLGHRCRELLWRLCELPETDPGRPRIERGRVYDLGRPAGRLTHYAEALLQLCEQAGPEGIIHWA